MCCCLLTSCHVLNNADAKVLINHGVQATNSPTKLLLQLCIGDVDAELHAAFKAQRLASFPQLLYARIV